MQSQLRYTARVLRENEIRELIASVQKSCCTLAATSRNHTAHLQINTLRPPYYYIRRRLATTFRNFHKAYYFFKHNYVDV